MHYVVYREKEFVTENNDKISISRKEVYIESVEAKYVVDQDEMLYFYNEEDRSDLDAPVAIYKKNVIVKIEKRDKGD